MNILLTGASGFIGRNLAQALGQRGHWVTGLSRRLGTDMARLCRPTDWHAHLQGVQAVVNAAGLIAQTRRQRFDRLHTQAPVALFQACGALGIQRVVQVSAVGADAEAASDFHRTKRAADEALLALPLQAVVLRPGLTYGRGGTSAALLGHLAGLPWVPLLDDGDQPLQPVHISDVVAALIQALEAPASKLPAQPLDVVGPQTLTCAEWLGLLRSATGRRPARWLRVPYPLARALCGLGQALHPLASPQTLQMLRRAPWAEPGPVQRFLGRELRSPCAALLEADASILWSQA